MANIPPRWDGPNQWYFVTIVTKQRKRLLGNNCNIELLQNAFKETHTHHPFRVGAITILPEHWHGLLRPGNEIPIEKIIGSIKKNFQKYIAASESVWQERFLDHRIRSEDDFNFHARYIMLNAFKHELVRENENYMHCFLHPDPFREQTFGSRGRNPGLP